MDEQSIAADQPEVSTDDLKPLRQDSALQVPVAGYRSAARGLYDFVAQTYCWMLIFLILYVLSIGPMYNTWRDAELMGHSPLLRGFYFPLAGLCSVSDTANDCLEWYISLWA